MNKQEFGVLLKSFLLKEKNIVKISRWVFQIYLCHIKDLDNSMLEIMENLFSMEDDPQFELTTKELECLAEKLILNEEDPIKQIIENRQKDHNI